jgi:predicted ATPase
MAAVSTQAPRITELVLENWRNFARAEVGLQRRAFLVGPNASGKSNLLDSLRFLRDVVRVGGGFQEAVRQREGISALRCLAARQNPHISIRVRIGTEAEPERWTYQVQFHQNGKRPAVSSERVWHGSKLILERPDDGDRRDAERLTQTHLEQVGNNQAFREVADFLVSIHYLHLVPQLVRDPERSVKVNGTDPYGSDFLDQVASTSERTRNARLKRIVSALQVAVPQLSELVLERDDTGRPHLKGKYEHWRPQGAWQTERQFSDGTLRLLGLLWVALEGDGPLLLEEPELSLHPGVVRHLPRLFARIQHKKGRQILISTHSPDLLRDEGIGLDEVLLLVPGREGTDVRLASRMMDVPALLEGGLSLPDVILPRTEPANAVQLSLFDLE